MRFSRSSSRSALLIAASVATLPLAFAHCGGDDATDPDAKSDASTEDGTGGDSAPGIDAAHDTSAGDTSAGDTSPGADSSNDSAADTSSGDTSVDDAADGGTGDGALDGGDAGDGFDGYTPGPVCDASDQCGDGGTCCVGHCSNVATDPHNCGSCGNTCVTNQFCTGTACEGAVFSNICENHMGTIVLDEYDTDNDAGGTMGGALAASCSPPVTVNAVSQDAGIANDPITGRPIAGPGDTLVLGGGHYGQITMGYLDSAG